MPLAQARPRGVVQLLEFGHEMIARRLGSFAEHIHFDRDVLVFRHDPSLHRRRVGGVTDGREGPQRESILVINDRPAAFLGDDDTGAQPKSLQGGRDGAVTDG